MAIWRPTLDPRHGPPYRQIVEALAADIGAGRLAAGARLPPYRALAYQLGLSANTTSRAYAEAARRALVSGEVGRGSFVRAAESLLEADEPGSLRRAPAGPIDLSRNLPLPGLAEAAVRRALNEILGGARLPALLDYQADADLAGQADADVIWLRHCGLEARPEQVTTTLGGQHGLACALMALLRPGDLLLTEALTYRPVVGIAERLGLNIATVAIDAEGALPEAFEALCLGARPKLLYLTPTLQTPTAATLSPERRQAIAAIAQRHDVLLLEDDVFGPLKPDRPAPLARWAPEHTVYVTSLSKAVAPGLRVGFLAAPARLTPALQRAVNLSVWMTPPLMLEIAARLILDGTAATLAAQQAAAAHRRQALARAILAATPFAADPHGLHVWLPLPEGWRADAFVAQCARQGLLVSEGRSFAPDPRAAPEAIRLCLSHEADAARLETGLRTIAHLLQQPPSAADPAL